jgi:hypothetical protein
VVPDVHEISHHAPHRDGDDLVRVRHRLGDLPFRHAPAFDLYPHQSDDHYPGDDPRLPCDQHLACDLHRACVPEATAFPDEASGDHRVVKVEDDHDLPRDPGPVRNELA